MSRKAAERYSTSKDNINQNIHQVRNNNQQFVFSEWLKFEDERKKIKLEEDEQIQYDGEIDLTSRVCFVVLAKDSEGSGEKKRMKEKKGIDIYSEKVAGLQKIYSDKNSKYSKNKKRNDIHPNKYILALALISLYNFEKFPNFVNFVNFLKFLLNGELQNVRKFFKIK